MLDTLYAVVAYANGEPAQPWWFFSRQRKARQAGTVAMEEGVAYSIVCSNRGDGHACRVDVPVTRGKR